ncbi:MAG TPA: hypothetical protein VL738_20880 [Dactylosporangium sp.]|jgi:hypothetical protein|nr:hypothetical protein [Dactylosporangium sp.]
MPWVLRADGTAAVTASEGAPGEAEAPVLPMSTRRARSERAAVSWRLVTVDFAAETPNESTAEASYETPGEPNGETSTIYTVYLSAAEELIEHIRAADVLNLGFRVESYLVSPDDAPDTTQPEFEFTLLSELPVRVEERD